MSFTKYKWLMGLNLQKLCKIECSDIRRENASGSEWSETHLFHGAGCGYADLHAKYKIATHPDARVKLVPFRGFSTKESGYSRGVTYSKI
ncbi:hypothetical protein BGZ81_006432 [Podila clonocystis]|nr:hypothetical protein BGZ81_006432 [Podila clonocystis]